MTFVCSHRTPHQRLLGRALSAAILTFTFALFITSSSPAAVVDQENVTHIFNAAHSLTGDCSVWSKDKVKDPACDEVPEGLLPPEGHLFEPSTAAVDRYGDQYVVNKNGSSEKEQKFVFHLDIFDPTGRYIGGFSVNDNFPGGLGSSPEISQIAVDSKGFLYMSVNGAAVRYDPTTYNPEAGEIEYTSQPISIPKTISKFIAVDPSNDHFYSYVSEAGVTEFGPATEGVPNEPLNPVTKIGGPITIDALHQKMYVGDFVEVGNAFEPDLIVVRALSLQPPYQLLATYDGSTTPGGNFGEVVHMLALAVDEASGDFFVSFQNRIYELEPDGTYVGTIKEPKQEYFRTQLAYDNSPLSPNQGYLYFPTGVTQGRLYAYEPISKPEPPVVESISVSGVNEEEAILRATVNPAGEVAHYVFEYTTQADFDENGFADAQVAGEGGIESTGEGVAVFAAAHGLSAGTAYRYRVRAENQCEPGGCEVEAQGSFNTFTPYSQSGGCANEALRSGESAQLPDCRAYELVTPADTGGRAPFAPGGAFGTWTASPDGSSLAFEGNGGAYPGQDTPGGTNGDIYLARRGASAWSSESVGLAGRQSSSQTPQGLSPDHSLSVVQSFPAGKVEAELPSRLIDYLRYQDGSVRPAGEGSLGTADNVGICGISLGGEHVVFLANSSQLEPGAAPAGTNSIYDRAADGTLQVISLLPGELTPLADEDAHCKGVSADGSAVAFEVGASSPIYLRLDNAQTVVGAPVGSTFAGLSAEGRYLFYVSSGDLFRYDSESEAAAPLAESGDAAPAYVSADGSTAYFTSKSVLTPEANPNGKAAVAGQDNLYLAREEGLRFVATVTESDVSGERGFDEWLGGIETPGLQPLRTSPNGSVLLFVSHADLSDFKSGGKRQVYRYDSNEGTLVCISCNPTGEAPSSEAALLSPGSLPGLTGSPASHHSIVPNLSTDGRRAFFESSERLVPADEDGLRDVYEWEAQGKGSCDEPGGCLFLISSGQSTRDDYLFGVSESGDDVFIYTSDLLNGEDSEEAPSVYDAKVGGGFTPPTPPVGECQGEACQPAAVAPQDATPASSSFEGAGNVRGETKSTRSRCPKGKRPVGRAGKSRCIPRHKKKQHKRANAGRRAHR